MKSPVSVREKKAILSIPPTIRAMSITPNPGSLKAFFKGVVGEWRALSPENLSGLFGVTFISNKIYREIDLLKNALSHIE